MAFVKRLPLSRLLTHFSLRLAASRVSGHDHFFCTSIRKRTTFGRQPFRHASRKLVSLMRVTRGRQREEKQSARWFRFICLVCADRWTRFLRLRNVTVLH